MSLQLGAVFGKIGGADVSEYPVPGTSAGGRDEKHRLVTATVSGRSLVTILMEIMKASGVASSQPQLYIGDSMSQDFGVGKAVYAEVVDADTEVGIYTKHTTAVNFSGTVYVSPLE